ncbi:hypothetical protein HY639_04545 [Candidatus Woesearchaeota archaeon]|nr:hypothetical protein [Candidatus Woesearchaeota archaeon]
MVLEQFLGLSSPDRRHGCLRESSPESIVEAAFRIWAQLFVNIPSLGLGEEPDRGLCDQLLHEAARILEPCNASLPSVMAGPAFFPEVHSELGGIHRYAGLFYTPLLKTDRRLIVPPSPWVVNLWGYRMNAGVLEMHANSTSIGKNATGGICINHGQCYGGMGQYADGLTAINHGYSTSLGQYASAGSFLNYATVMLHIGEHAHGGTYVSFTESGLLGTFATRGLYIAPASPEFQFGRQRQGVISINSIHLQADPMLHQKIIAVKTAGLSSPDDVRKLLSDLTAYCTEHYSDAA